MKFFISFRNPFPDDPVFGGGGRDRKYISSPLFIRENNISKNYTIINVTIWLLLMFTVEGQKRTGRILLRSV